MFGSRAGGPEVVRDLRRNETPAERRLWQILRNRRLSSLKFRRQFPIRGFIADFCCHERRLIVELDGSVHAEQPERDEERAQVLEAFGYKILRFSNGQIWRDPESVLTAIQDAAGIKAESRKGG
jgi:very-short-patch-repair endonuclease